MTDQQQHPLTDEIIEENFTPEYGYVESDSILGVSQIDCGFSSSDLRRAYSMGADKQLEQVIRFLEDESWSDCSGTIYYLRLARLLMGFKHSFGWWSNEK